MNKELYQQLGHNIGGYPCVSLPKPENSIKKDRFDKVLSGPRGEIREYLSEDREKVIGYQVLIPFKNTFEKIFIIEIKELRKWVRRLEVSVEYPHKQLPWANNPNLRLERFLTGSKRKIDIE